MSRAAGVPCNPNEKPEGADEAGAEEGGVVSPPNRDVPLEAAPPPKPEKPPPKLLPASAKQCIYVLRLYLAAVTTAIMNATEVPEQKSKA